MIFEKRAIDLTEASILTSELGETWLAFAKSITEFNFNTFDKAYNLIAISQEETTVQNQILEILIDEGMTVTEQTNAVRDILIANSIQIITELGIEIDKDQITIDHLPLLTNIIDVAYILDGYEDLLSLSVILEAADLETKDRFIMVIEKLLDLEDTSLYEMIISDVSEHLLEVLRTSLINPDADIEVPQYVSDRVRGNKEFLRGTLAWEHVVSAGKLGIGWLVIYKYYLDRLNEMKENEPKKYIKEIICLMLCSGITNESFLDKLSARLGEDFSDVESLYYADGLVKKLGLTNE